MRRRTFVKHGLEFEHGSLETPEDGITGVVNALESRLRQKAVKDRLGLGVDIALTSDVIGGLH